MVDIKPGDQLGSYRIEDEIGIGGMAVVYRAQHISSGQVVALKILYERYARSPELVSRFRREANIARDMNHSHIIQVYEHGVIDRYPYLASEYIAGGSLDDSFASPVKLTLAASAVLLQQIGSALDYAHSKGIVHRDLKPANILLDGNRTVLSDFGIAKTLDGTHHTHTGAIMGTPSFMSPEQARGRSNLDKRADLYALGVLAYLMATGKLPFTGTEPLAVLHQHLTASPPRPTLVNPELPPEMDRLLFKALAKNPDKRFQSAAELVKAYQKAIQSAGIHKSYTSIDIKAVHPVTASISTYRRTGKSTVTSHQRTRRWPVPLLIFLPLLCILLAAGLILSRQEPNEAIEIPTESGQVYTRTAEAQTRIAAAFTMTATPSRTPTSTFSSTPTATATQTATPTATFTATATPAHLTIISSVGSFVRSGPGTEYETIATVDSGETFPITAYAYASSGDLWYLIRLRSGREGWISEYVAELAGDSLISELAMAMTIPSTPTFTPTHTFTPTFTPSKTPTPTNTPDTVCGDGVCSSSNENVNNCPRDCARCGDGICSSEFEGAMSCPSDCARCGDGICSSNESNSSCPDDCRPSTYCGDGSCNGGENSSSCPTDCGGGGSTSSSGVIPFVVSGTLNPVFRWRQGAAGSIYRSASQNSLTIEAIGGTDQWMGPGTLGFDIDNAPMMLYSINGNFDARVLLEFYPYVNYQLAGIGVRSTSNNNTWIRICKGYDYLTAGGLAAHAATNDGTTRYRALDYASSTVYLRIQRAGNTFTLSYSQNGNNWSTLETISFTMPSNTEIYLFAYGTGNSISAQFSNFEAYSN